MYITITLDIDIRPDEETQAVLKGYFSSHPSNRKVNGFKVIEEQKPLEVQAPKKPELDAEIKHENATAGNESLDKVLAGMSYQDLMSIKKKYNLPTNTDRKVDVLPVVTEFLAKNPDVID